MLCPHQSTVSASHSVFLNKEGPVRHQEMARPPSTLREAKRPQPPTLAGQGGINDQLIFNLRITLLLPDNQADSRLLHG